MAINESRAKSIGKMQMEGCVPWPDELVKEYKEKGYWEDITFGEHFDEWVEKYADRPAIASKGQEVTYRQMGIYVNRLAYHMAQMGIKTYDRVIFQLFNGPEVLYLIYACFKLGAIPVCSLATHRFAEISFFAKTTEARAHAIPSGVFQGFDYEAFADEIRNEVPSMEFVLTAGKPSRPNMVSINELIEKVVDLEVAKKELASYRPDPMEPAVFQLSGGTTGVPKIIPRTHNDYYYNAKCSAVAYDYNEDTRFIAPLPNTHNAPLSQMIMPIHLSGGMVVSVAPKPEEIIQEIVLNKVNYMTAGGFLVRPLLSMPSEQVKQLFGSIKKLWAAAIKPEPLKMLREILKSESHQNFGMSEGLITVTRKDDPLEVKLYTQGRGVSEADEIKIVDPETLQEMPQGDIGEMICRGPYTIRGYYKAPERNQEAFTPEGFYRSGDLGKQDPQGNFTWCGRIKDCIDRGGEKVNAEEVEIHVRAFPKVQEVAVVSMPDKRLGENICVYVIPKPGEKFTLEELRDFILNERKIAKFKAPERLEFINEFPVTHVGKLDKKGLRAMIAEKVKAEQGLK
jgi:2,3-dihydroxybenzoate-AMP ligase